MDLLKKLDDMITAEEFLKSKKYPSFNNSGGLGVGYCHLAMIEFAKLHVEAAKKEYHKVLVKQGIVTDAGIGYFDNAYSLENIK